MAICHDSLQSFDKCNRYGISVSLLTLLRLNRMESRSNNPVICSFTFFKWLISSAKRPGTKDAMTQHNVCSLKKF